MLCAAHIYSCSRVFVANRDPLRFTSPKNICAERNNFPPARVVSPSSFPSFSFSFLRSVPRAFNKVFTFILHCKRNARSFSPSNFHFGFYSRNEQWRKGVWNTLAPTWIIVAHIQQTTMAAAGMRCTMFCEMNATQLVLQWRFMCLQLAVVRLWFPMEFCGNFTIE